MKTRHFNTILYIAFMAILFGSSCSKDSDTSVHYIGEEFGGGIVFDVSADGRFGLIAETVDQGTCSWSEAFELVKSGEHSEAGKVFTDWRLPTIDELEKLYKQRDIVGSFTGDPYWSSSEYDANNAWIQVFKDGSQQVVSKDGWQWDVRAVRDF